VKVKSFRAPVIVVATVAQGRTILRGTWALFCARKWLALATAAVALAIAAAIWPHDRALLDAIHFWNSAQEQTAHNLAWYLSTWGDYPTYNLPFALALWIYGVVTKSSAWRRAARLYFFGASLAGLADDCIRLTAGRPRPDAHMADGFYGLTHSFKGGFQSFPSGHAASVIGAAVALLTAEVPLGLVTLGFGVAVVWARMELYRHYPSDVVVGSIIGLYFGLLVGLGAKLRMRR
jgi:membrane-associated phospholipid phosphatase